jgi:prephenate dehydrogenase
MPPPFRRVAVLGTGLIGGSFGLAARASLPGVRIAGWDKPQVLSRARARGAIDEGYAELPKALAGADLVYVALPVGLTIARLPEIAKHAESGALVTDAASTKRAVCAAAANSFTKKAFFLGGHPMAGKEDSGIDAADAALFRGAPYALIGSPGHDASDSRVATFLDLLKALGARPVWMDAEAHDRAAAIVSHLPQLVAVALAGVVHEAIDQPGDQAGLPLALAGRGLRDALRLAGSPYGVWRDIILTNADHLEAGLDRLAQAIDDLRRHLRGRELEEDFAAANEVYKILRNLQ